jgi:hypothetical protein
MEGALAANEKENLWREVGASLTRKTTDQTWNFNSPKSFLFGFVQPYTFIFTSRTKTHIMK